jgi:hypothetical protein
MLDLPQQLITLRFCAELDLLQQLRPVTVVLQAQVVESTH